MTIADRLAGLPLRVGRRLPPGVRRAINVARGIDTPRLVERPPGRRVAVVAPHPDDELIGCGGTVAKHLAAGDDVDVVFVTSGERTAGLAALPAAEGARRREEEARAAAATLGVDAKRCHFLRYPDGGVTPDATCDETLGEAMRRLAPDLVYLPFPLDAHRDHVAVTSLAAARLPASVRHVALYEVWGALYPTSIVDVSATIDAKLGALACYESARASVDYLHTVRGLAAWRSAQGLHGRGYAEAFVVVTPDQLAELLRA